VSEHHVLTIQIETRELFVVDVDYVHHHDMPLNRDDLVFDTYEAANRKGIELLAQHTQLKRFRIHKWTERVGLPE
jgi:hypothetical protein